MPGGSIRFIEARSVLSSSSRPGSIGAITMKLDCGVIIKGFCFYQLDTSWHLQFQGQIQLILKTAKQSESAAYGPNKHGQDRNPDRSDESRLGSNGQPRKFPS